MKQEKLNEVIEEILWNDWDPIELKKIEGEYQDEYNGYVSSIFKLLKQNPSEFQIKKLLYQHANLNMGLSTSLDEHQLVAKKLTGNNRIII